MRGGVPCARPHWRCACGLELCGATKNGGDGRPATSKLQPASGEGIAPHMAELDQS